MLLETLLLNVIPLVTAVNLSKFHIKTQITEVFEFSSQLLQKYQHYDVVIHVENDSLETTGQVLVTNPVVTTLYNHDKSNMLKRPQGLKCINVVTFARPENIARYLVDGHNVHEKDDILFIIGDNDFTDLGSLKARLLGVQALSTFGNVLIFVYYEKKLEVYGLCFYCGKTGHLNFLKETSYENFSLTDHELYPDKIRDFHGYQLKIAYINYFPFIYCVKKNKKTKSLCKKAVGVDYELLKTVSKALNFTYQLLEVSNDSYADLFRGLALEKFDLAIGGLTVIESRKKSAKFSSVIKLEPIVLTYHYKERLVPDILIIDRSHQTRFSIYFAWLAANLFLFCRFRCDPLIKTPLLNAFTIVAESLCEQPVPYLSTIVSKNLRWCLYLFFTFWWMYVLPLNVMYKSQLTAALIHPKPPVITPDYLVDAGYIMVTDVHTMKSLLPTMSDDEIALVNRSSTISVDDKCDALAYAQTHDAMILTELSKALLHTTLTCRKLKKNVKFSIIGFRQSPHAWAFKLRAPFVDSFNVYIKRVMSAGLIHVWTNNIRIDRTYSLYYKDLQKRDKRGTFEVIFNQLVLYLVLLGAATVCFLIEIVYYKMTEGKRTK